MQGPTIIVPINKKSIQIRQNPKTYDNFFDATKSDKYLLKFAMNVLT